MFLGVSLKERTNSSGDDVFTLIIQRQNLVRQQSRAVPLSLVFRVVRLSTKRMDRGRNKQQRIPSQRKDHHTIFIQPPAPKVRPGYRGAYPDQTVGQMDP
jgi:hypothetical protein